MSEDRTDALVVGAGPAGSVSAFLLARRGLRVVLADRAVFPRHKVCGCCLAPGGQGVLRRAGLAEVLEGSIDVRSLLIRTTRATGRVAIPRYTVIARDTLDQRLIDRARDAGVDVRTGVPVRLTENPGLSWLGDRPLTARAVVLADGLAGSAARDVPAMAWKVRRSSHVGFSTVLDIAPGDDRTIAMHVHRDGYVGVAPADGSRVAIAAALRPSAVRDAGPGEVVRRILDGCGAAVRPDGPLRGRGAPELTRRRVAPECGGWLFAVGDAAGYVEPFTGEGMSWAMRVAEAVVPCVLASVAGEYRAGAWSRTHRAVLAHEHAACAAVAAALRCPSAVGLALTACAAAPALAGAVARVLVGAPHGERFA